MTLPLPGQTPPSTRTPEEVAAELAEIQAGIDQVSQLVEGFYARRDEVWVEATEGLATPMSQQRIADASGVKQATVSLGLRKIAERRAALAEQAAVAS